MKKIVILSIILLLLTGCSKDKEEKFDKYEENNTEVVNNIKSIELEDETKEFENMMVLDNNTLQTQFGLTIDDVDNYVGQVSYELNTKMYLAFKPAKGKEERVKKLVESYINSIETRLEMQKNNIEDTSDIDSKINMIKNMVREEYNGYLIYISSNSNDEILTILKNKLSN